MTILPHIQFLESRMLALSHLPTKFEYYSAIHLTKLHQIRYYVYQDIPASHKRYSGFPIEDRGVDLIDETFRNIVQVKYYGPRMKIKYSTLSTFLGTPLLVGDRHLRMTLVRTTHCKITSDIYNIVKRGDMTDVTLCHKAFLKHLSK
jgi:hypothetical protein